MTKTIVTTSPERVPRILTGDPLPSWQEAMRRAIRDPHELCRILDLPETSIAEAAADFPLFAPREYVARMRPGDPKDPLLRQVLPHVLENSPQPDTRSDPVGDSEAKLAPGLLQKYQGRALLIASGACAVHCRYCFRRHFPYSAEPRSLDAWEPALRQIADDPSLREVILSGGDPLTLGDRFLARLTERLEQIGHLSRLRIHTRLPIVIPQRVSAELLDWLSGSRLQRIVVIHANHAAELDQSVADALDRLHQAGATLLNQAVLLRRVNDSVEAQQALCERLVDLGVIPYYLHQMDRVTGAAHFEVPIDQGRTLIAELRTRLPGYAVPRYVQENIGEPSKTVLA